MRVHEGSPALELHTGADGEARVRTPDGEVHAYLAVLATNAYAAEADDFLAQAVRPVRGQMIAYPALAERLLEPVVYRNHGFEYFRQDTEGRFLIGGFRQTEIEDEVGVDELANAAIVARLRKLAEELYPPLRGLELEHEWAGIMGFSHVAVSAAGFLLARNLPDLKRTFIFEDRATAVRVASLFLGLTAPVIVTDPASAETIKYAANGFLA